MNNAVRAISTGGSMMLIAGGAWGALAYSSIYSAQQEQSKVQTEYSTHSQAKQQAEVQLAQTRETAVSLQRDQVQQNEFLSSVDAQISAARQKIQDLQKSREEANHQANLTTSTLREAHRKARELEIQMAQSMERLQAMQSSLDTANAKVLKAQQALNPLESPLLKNYFGTGSR